MLLKRLLGIFSYLIKDTRGYEYYAKKKKKHLLEVYSRICKIIIHLRHMKENNHENGLLAVFIFIEQGKISKNL